QAPSSGWKRLSWLAILPFLAGTMFLCNPVRAKVVPLETTPDQPVSVDFADTTQSVPFQLVEQKPTFQGGTAAEFSQWVNANLKYPQTAKDAGVQGRVTLQFTVYPDGSVRDTKVLRGAHPDLDAEALRVVSASPNWTPGYVKGEPVKVTYTFPVIFRLNGDKNEQKTASIRVTGEANDVFIRGALADSVLFVLDGKPVPSRKDIDLETIESIQVLKDEKAIEKYGEKGRYGVIEFTSKKQ
ncbi:MAG: TonB family protein, partial [Bacteroidales bacterium]|nr:TonB family protein [Bacteroidales bacterium]